MNRTGKGSYPHNTGKVSILLSLYHPDPVFLKEQLISLNEQDYPDIELLVWNDCPEEKIDYELFDQCITHFPIHCYDEGINLGYTKAFERLTELATGEYVSYCDQDDIWLSSKIRRCIEEIEKNNAVAAVCDRSLIDQNGNLVCKSVRDAETGDRFTWRTGDHITPRAAFFSYCTGMTLVAKREEIVRFLPLNSELPHDQQLIFFLSAAGVIVSMEEALVKQRIHGNNSSGTLAGISKKEDYYIKRCIPIDEMLCRYEKLHPDDPKLSDMKECCKARIQGDVFGLLKYRRLIPELYKYEIVLSCCPGFLFIWYLRHRNKSK